MFPCFFCLYHIQSYLKNSSIIRTSFTSCSRGQSFPEQPEKQYTSVQLQLKQTY